MKCLLFFFFLHLAEPICNLSFTVKYVHMRRTTTEGTPAPKCPHLNAIIRSRGRFMRHKYMRNRKKTNRGRGQSLKACSCFLPPLSARAGRCARVAPTLPVMTHGSAISPLYHFTLSDGTPLSAQTRCKFCCPPNPDVQPFIMGIHTIDRYCGKQSFFSALSPSF